MDGLLLRRWQANARSLQEIGVEVKHALIIEDNRLIAEMIRDYLLEYGYNSVDLASTQAEAIQLAKQRCPDLITADDKLEQGSGIAAIQYICHDRRIPVLFLIADPANLRMLLPNAVFLLKPFSENALDNAIQTVEKLAVTHLTTDGSTLLIARAPVRGPASSVPP